MNILTLNKPFILEKGYNTSGLYAFLTSMFYQNSEYINKILNTDNDDVSIIYFQEFLKIEIISRLHSGKSLTVNQVGRFRNLLYKYGWRKNMFSNIDALLLDPNPADIYDFLFAQKMKNILLFERVERYENRVDILPYNIIEISSCDICHTNNVINLSESVRNWVNKFID